MWPCREISIRSCFRLTWQRSRRRQKPCSTEQGGAPGHIFNLGHGVLPETDPANVKALASMVHEMGASRSNDGV